MKPGVASLAAALACGLSAAASADIPGGHVYLGVGLDEYALFNRPVYEYRYGPTGPTLERASAFGSDLSLHLDVELERYVFSGFGTVGGGHSGHFARLTLGGMVGRFFGEGDVTPYIASGLALGLMGAFDGENFEHDTSGAMLLMEAGVKLRRSWQFGRVTAFTSLWVPAFAFSGAVSPSLQLGLRLEL
jgi:hypothetical protein